MLTFERENPLVGSVSQMVIFTAEYSKRELCVKSNCRRQSLSLSDFTVTLCSAMTKRNSVSASKKNHKLYRHRTLFYI